MNLGKLDRKITVQFRNVNVAPNAYGERLRSFTPSGSPDFETWALVEYLSGGEKIADGRETSNQRVAFTVRWCTDLADVTPQDRVQYDSKTFDIESIQEQGRNTSLRLLCNLVR